MKTCFLCNKKPNGNHWNSCIKKNNSNLTIIELKYLSILNINEHTKLLSKDKMEHLYIDCNYSLPDFLKEFELSYKDTQFLLNYYNITQRTFNEAVMSDKTVEKRIDTINKKYGVDNVSKSDVIKQKKKDISLKKYGVDNYFKIDGIRKVFHDIMMGN